MQSTDQCRQIDKKQFWSQHIALWRQSGQTQRAYCRDNGLSHTAFYYWRPRLQSDLLPPSRHGRLRLVALDDHEPAKPNDVPSVPLRILVEGCVLEVHQGTDPTLLENVLSLLRAR